MAFNQFPQKGGIPSGNTATRPGSPAIGDTYYNGEKGYLEIYNGTTWLVASAVPGAPSVTVTDVGTSRAYGSARGTVSITAPSNGGLVDAYVITASNAVSSYTVTSASATTVTLDAGLGGAYNLSAYAYNNFGNSASFNSVPTLTTIPGTPTLAVSSISQTTATLSVTIDNGGKAISNFETSLDGTTYTALSPAQTAGPIVFSGLTEGTSYTFRVRAINANGTGTAGTLTVTTPYNVSYLVAGGGGGGGGYYYSGGGGGAGVITGSLLVSAATPYRVTVGAGGAQQNTENGTGNAGSLSYFSTFIGLNGTGSRDATVATGAGGPKATLTAGGKGGGTGASSESGAGGGGGADVDGGAGGASSAGNGGNGVASSITGTSTYYGGGGGGSDYNDPGTRGSGGLGGGGLGTKGSGSVDALGTAGTANTGGGGGGASHPARGAAYGYGWAGGSGLVILRIPSAGSATFSGGVSSSLSTSVVGFKVYTVTAAGPSDTVTFS
jgi:hypothetical protein